MKVLVSDVLGDVGIKMFQEEPGIEVDVNTGLAPDELKSIIGEYDALVIRSATKVTENILDAARNLKVVGRIKDVIIRGGQNIYPPEIENLLISHPKVAAAALVGMPDSVMGEKACLYVVPEAGEALTFDDMVAFLKEKGIAPYKLPERLEFLDDMPLVAGMKVDKKVLRGDIRQKLKEEEKAYIEDKRAQAFIKRTKNYAYQTLTPEAESQHLRGFMITIEPRQAHKPVAYKHEGEEFVFVMEGSLELTLDNKVNNLKTGESMHYNSEIPHKLKNLGNETTRCLVMLYTP